MHTTRVITSIVGLVLLIAIMSIGNPLPFGLLVSIAVVIGLLEFYRIVQAKEFPVYLLPGVLSGWLLSLVPLIQIPFSGETLLGFTISLIALFLFLYALLVGEPLEDTLQALASTFLGIFYVSWLLLHLVFIRGLSDGKWLIFYLLLVVWAGDTGAYYVGRFLGKHKLAPAVSPNKTIEGAIGGLAASVAASFIAKFTFLPIISSLHCAVLAVFLAIIAQSGDLCESMLKRAANVKDSGNILPGHGGILDRLDGVMFAAPVLYYYAIVFLVA